MPILYQVQQQHFKDGLILWVIYHAFHWNNYMSCIPWLSHVFTCTRQNMKLSLSHALVYSFIIFKYVILILLKEKYILGRIGLYFWDLGRSWTIFRDLGSKAKYFKGGKEIIYRDMGRSVHYFQGSREHRHPLGGSQYTTTDWVVLTFCRKINRYSSIPPIWRVSKWERWQRSGIDTIKYHTWPRIPHENVTKTQLNITNESLEHIYNIYTTVNLRIIYTNNIRTFRLMAT